MHLHVRLLWLLMFTTFLLLLSPQAHAEGTYANIGTATGTDGSPDVVSWSQGYPIMIDSYGHYIVPVLPDGDTQYNLAYSNDGGSTWAEADIANADAPYNRISAVYDPISDKIHVIETRHDVRVSYRRFIIRRNASYQITDIVKDPDFTPLALDSLGTCSAIDPRDPIALFKDDGDKGILVAFWSIKKTDCGGQTVTETRASMINLSNTSSDGVAGNWTALNNSSDNGVAPAGVDYNILYTYSGAYYTFQHSAMIRGGSGSKANDIYYFNIDQNDTHGFRRLSWNSSNSDWSGAWTARVTFGGSTGDNSGYSLKKELISKPVYATGQDKVYIGIARWLDATNGDTQSLYAVDNADSISLISNIYSAGGSHCLYPTFDLAYDSNQNQLYFFYLKSGASNVCGHTYYKTYNGSTFGNETAFFTVDSRSVDIPVTYQSRYDDKILLFFRVNNAADPGTSPHEVYFGYVPLNSTATNVSSSVTTPVNHSSYSDFSQTCNALSSTSIINENGGEVALASSFRDDFETPRSPYTLLFSNKWSTGVWSTGFFEPQPNGTLLLYDASTGVYAIGVTGFNKKIMDFRAKFTAHAFQHIGWTNDTGFGNYIIFSTMNGAQLNARVEAGSGETNAQLGGSYLGSYHNYRIEWGSDIKFYIDDFSSAVATFNVNETDTLKPILSNNTTTSGSDLTVDWIRLNDYPTTTGTFTSCSLDSGSTGTVWGTLSFGSSAPASTSVSIATRTSADNSSWSSWSSDITSGSTISSANNRYLQYRVTLNGTSTSTSTFTNLSLSFASPTPTNSPTPTPTSTATPTNTPTPTVTPSSSGNSGSSSANTSSTQCSAGVPGNKAPELLFAIPESTSSIRLYFTDGEKPISQYSLIYGTESNKEQYGQNNIGIYGTREYTVSSLAANTAYFFKIQGKNDCAGGPWSNTISATTKGFFTENQLQVVETKIEPLAKKKTVDLCKPYTVQNGDTLWDIINIYLKDPKKLQEVVNLNKKIYPSIENNDLQVGWEIKLKDCSKREKANETVDQRTYDLQIQVTDDQKKPVKDATVELHSTPRKAITDINGIAKFTNVEQGEHKVIIAYNNYSSEQNIYLSGEADEYKLSIEVRPINPFLSWPVVASILFLLSIVGYLLWKLYSVQNATQKTFS